MERMPTYTTEHHKGEFINVQVTRITNDGNPHARVRERYDKTIEKRKELERIARVAKPLRVYGQIRKQPPL